VPKVIVITGAGSGLGRALARRLAADGAAGLERFSLSPTGRLADTCTALGFDPRKRPSSRFASVTDVFRALIDLPAELSADLICLRPRRKRISPVDDTYAEQGGARSTNPLTHHEFRQRVQGSENDFVLFAISPELDAVLLGNDEGNFEDVNRVEAQSFAV
jgi:hypothetical protein